MRAEQGWWEAGAAVEFNHILFKSLVLDCVFSACLYF